MRRSIDICRDCDEFCWDDVFDKYCCLMRMIEVMSPISRVEWENVEVPTDCPLTVEYFVMECNNKEGDDEND